MTDSPVQLFKAIADDTRLRSLLLIIDQQEMCVCELTEALALSQPKISRHLAQLRESGLLNDRRQGQWVYYAINSQLPSWTQQILEQIYQANRAYIADDLKRLNRMGNRPERLAECCN